MRGACTTCWGTCTNGRATGTRLHCREPTWTPLGQLRDSTRRCGAARPLRSVAGPNPVSALATVTGSAVWEKYYDLIATALFRRWIAALRRYRRVTAERRGEGQASPGYVFC